MSKFNYYKSELSNLKNKEDPVTIKLTDYDGNSTKYLSLNIESIRELELFLNELKVTLNNKT